MKVVLAKSFAANFLNFPKSDQEKIYAFITHIELYGLHGLKGRNKSSDNVPKDDPNWLEKVKYAQEHRLWHYHIGIPYYEQANNGDRVSRYVLHYSLDVENDTITILELSEHPPLLLPLIKV